MSRKRERANSFIENCNKINDDENLFNYEFFCNLNNLDCSNIFNTVKDKCKKDFLLKNEVIRLNDNYYYKQSEYQNIKFSPDCFSNSGDLIDIFVSIKDHTKIKINNIPKSYEDYIQVILNILNLNRCIIYVYHVDTFNNTREIRKSNDKITNIEFIIKEDMDIYWGVNYVTRLVINRKRNFNVNSIETINNKIFSIDVDEYITPRTKKFKSERYLSQDWVAASKTRNYALNDPILDYCRAFNIIDIEDKPNKMINNFEPSSKIERKNKKVEDCSSFIDYLLTSGNKFEDKIVKTLKDKFGSNLVEVCKSIDSRNMKHFDTTISEMKNGTPIIYQAVMYNFKYKVFGSADLLVRSDYLNKLVDIDVINEEDQKINAPLLSGNYHYRVIDIKHSKLHLNTDKKTIRNNANIKPFKTQIAIYNLALGEMQGYLPDQSYILGNGWILNKYVDKKEVIETSTSPFNSFGTIDFKNNDKTYYDTALCAVSWINDLNNKDDFNHNPPNDDRLYPNMCNSYDGIYHKFKTQMAKKYNEITDIWNCGLSNREIAFTKGVKSWKDSRCNSELMEIKGKRSVIIDNILDFNRKRDKVININKIDHNFNNWRSEGLVFYLDFETINSSLLNSSEVTKLNVDCDFIFMIGVGWKESNNRNWNYKCFTAENISITEERRIVEEVLDLINSKNEEFGVNAKVYHWSHAERTIYNKFNDKYGNSYPDINWFDLLSFFKDNNILVLDSFNFSLKTVVNSMNRYGLIKTNWIDGELNNGLDAMFFSWREYLKKVNVNNSSLFNEVKRYNEIDCKVLFEIHNYLKDSH